MGEKEEKYGATIEKVVSILRSIIEDTSVPRNIRRTANDAITVLLNKEQTPGLRASIATSILDEISSDPNMPLHTRTKIWSCMSQLETIVD